MSATNDTHADQEERPDWTDAEALIRAGWRSGPDLAHRLGISVRTLQRRASRGDVRRVQIGRETFYATNARGDTGDATGVTRATGDVFAGFVQNQEVFGLDRARGGGVQTDDRRHPRQTVGVARGADQGLAAMLDLIRELREELVDAERRAAVAAAERDALQAIVGMRGADIVGAAQSRAESVSSLLVGGVSDEQVVSSAPVSVSLPADRQPTGMEPTPSTVPSDEMAVEVRRLRGVVERRTAELEEARRHVASLERDLARTGAELVEARRERGAAQASSIASRAASDDATREHDATILERDESSTSREPVSAASPTASSAVPEGGIVVAGERIAFADVEARMKQLVIERNEFRNQAKEFRDQRRALERDIKRMRRSRNTGRRLDDSGWSKR